jgi:hypothetical protein
MAPKIPKGGLLPIAGSLGSLLAALLCCLPLGTLMMAAGSAAASIAVDRLRPWLLAFSVACLVFAFIQTYYARRCAFRQRRARTVLVWFTAIVVVSMLAFPRFTSTVLSGRLPAFAATSAFRDFDRASFVQEFNEASSATRVVVLLSPT